MFIGGGGVSYCDSTGEQSMFDRTNFRTNILVYVFADLE